MAAALLAASCTVSADKQVPCADDSSCPKDYPYCDQSVGKCSATQTGTGQPLNSIAIVSVVRDNPGAADAAINTTATVSVVARASTGVVKDSVKVTAGTTALTLLAATPPTYTFKLDALALFPNPPGVNATDPSAQVTLTASMLTGDSPTTPIPSTPKTVTVDTRPPTLSGAALAAIDLQQGGTVTVTVTASEALSAIGGTVSSGTTIVTLGETSKSGFVHTLSAVLPANAAPGPWTTALTATDLAGNSSCPTATPVCLPAPGFTVHAPISITALTLDKTAVTTGQMVTISLTVSAAIPGKPTITVGLSGTAGTALTNVTPSSGSTFTASYSVQTADVDGQYVVSVSATDAAGNVAASNKAFTITKTPPALPGIVLGSNLAGPNLPLTFTVPVGQVPANLVATVNGHAASCGSLSTSVSCSYTPTMAADFPSGPGIIAAATVAVTVKDVLGNTNSTSTTVKLDSQPPTLSVTADLNTVDARIGTLLTMNVLPSKPLSLFSASVLSGSTSVGVMSDIAPPDADGTRHLGFSVPPGTAAGAYTISISATDLALNVIAAPVTRSFNVRAPFTLTTMSVTAAVSINGTPAVTTGNSANISLTLPAGVTLASGAKPTMTIAPASGGTASALTVAGSGLSWTSSYTVTGSETDGLYNITANVTDIAGNNGSIVKTLLIQKTPPSFTSGIVLGSSEGGPNKPISFSFTLSAVAATITATVNGNLATCSGTSTTTVSCTYTPTSTDVPPGTTATVTVGVIVKDVLNNAASTSTTVILDNTLPTLAVTADLNTTNAKAGTLLTMNVKPSEPTSAFSATVSNSVPTVVGSMTDLQAPDADGTRHLGFAVTPSTAAGTYTISISVTDLSNNVIAAPVTRTFTVYAPFTLTSLVLNGGATVNGYPAVTNLTGKKTINATLTVPPAVVISGNPAVTVTTFTGQTRASSASCTSNTCTASYVVDSTSTDGEGVASFAVSVTDVAGNQASITKPFLINKTGPQFLGSIALATSIAGPSTPGGVQFSFDLGAVANTVTATVKGETATCTGTSTTSVSCSYVVNSAGADVGANSIVSPPNAPISVTVADILGNATTLGNTTLTLDNQPPTLGSQTPSPASGATAGTQVTLCICPSKTLSSLSAVIKDSGSTVVGTPTLLSTVSGSCTTACGGSPPAPAQQFTYNVDNTLATGTYTYAVTAADLANNTGTYAPGFTVNGSFTISGLSVGLNPASVGSGAGAVPAFMGPGNATQYSCTTGTGSSDTGWVTGSTGQISVAVTLPGSITPKANNPVYTLVDSGGHSFTLLPTATQTPSGNTYTLNTCIPATAAGYSSNAVDGFATLSVVATSTTNKVSNTLSAPIFIGSKAPVFSNGTTTALVGPQQGTLTFGFTASAAPATGPSFTVTIPNATTGNTHTVTNCTPTGLVYSCTYTLSSSDKSYAGSGAVTIALNQAATTDAIGNQVAAFSITGTIYDGTLPTLNGSITATNVQVPGFSGTANGAVVAKNGQQITFTGSANTGSSTALASAAVSTSGSNGTSAGCTVSGQTFSCTWNVSKTGCTASACTAQTVTTNLTDAAGNVSANITTPQFTIDNVLPVVGTITATSVSFPTLFTGTTDNAVAAANGQQISFTGSATTGASLSLASATIASTGNGSSGGCSVSGTTFTCLWNVSNASCGTTACTTPVAAITVTDTVGNTSASANSAKFTIDNVVPTIGTITLKNVQTLVSGTTDNSVVAQNGQQISFTATVTVGGSLNLASATIGSSGNGSSGGCSVSGTSITCLWNVSNASCGTSACTTPVATITATDTVGNVSSGTNSAKFTIDNVPPAVGTITMKNLQTLVSGTTDNSVVAQNGQQISFTGTATVAASQNLASATITSTGNGSSGGCSVSGTSFTCQWNVSNASCGVSTCTTPVATITVADFVGNASSATNSAKFTIDNVPPTVGTITMKNLQTLASGTTDNSVVAKNGQQISFSGTATVAASQNLASATIASTGNGSSGGCTVSGTTFTCLWNVSNASCGVSACSTPVATITVTDFVGNASSGTNSAKFTIDNVPPTIGTITLQNLQTLVSGTTDNSVVAQNGQQISFTGTATVAASQNLASATIASTGNGSSGGCSVSGTTFTCLWNVSNASCGVSACSTPVATITVTDFVGNASSGTNSAKFTIDNVPPTIGTITMKNLQTLTSGTTDNSVVAQNGQQISFSGTATVAASQNLASATIASTGNGSSGGCSVSGTTFTCLWNVSNASCGVSACTTPVATITVTDFVGNPSSATNSAKFTIDNVPPTIGTITMKNLQTLVSGTTNNSVVAQNGQQISFSGTATVAASQNLASATIASTGNGSSGGCTVSGTTFTCLWNVSNASCGVSACTTPVATITVTDIVGNASSGTNSAKFTIDNVPPTIGTITMKNLQTLVSGTTDNSVVAQNGQQISFSGTATVAASQNLASATIASAGNGSSGGCSVSGTTFTCLWNVSSASCGVSTCTTPVATITVTDFVGNASSATNSAKFTIDNVPPTIGTITLKNLQTLVSGTTDNSVVAKNGQQISFSGSATVAASQNLASATIASTGNGSSGGCTVSGTTFSCLWNVSNASCGVTACTTPVATITVTDALGNTSSGTNSAKFTIDNVAPTGAIGTVTPSAPGLVGTTLTIPITLTDANAGVATSTNPTVTVGGLPATLSTGPTGGPNTVTYSYSYTLTGAETVSTCAVSVSLSGYSDLVGNAGVTQTTNYTVDLSSPTITVSGTTPNISGSMVTFSAATGGACAGTTTVYAFGDSTTAANATSTSAATTNICAAGTCQTLPGTTLTITGTHAVVFLKAIDASGPASSVVEAKNLIAAVNPSSVLEETWRAFGQPSTPTTTPDGASTDFTGSFGTTDATQGTGTWSAASTTGAPGSRARAQAAYDSFNRVFVVMGGIDSTTGLPSTDLNTYLYSVAGNSWSTLSGATAVPSNASAGTACSASFTRFDGTAAFDPSSKRVVVHSGVCAKNTTEAWALNDFWKLDASSATNSWANLSLTATDVGAQGALFSDGTSTIYNWGFNDATNTATLDLGTLASISSTATYSEATQPATKPTNRFGSAYATVPIGATGFGSEVGIFFGGFTSQNHAGTGCSAGNTCAFASTTLQDTNAYTAGGTNNFAAVATTSPPAARAYAGLASQTAVASDSTMLMYGGIPAECTNNGTTSGTPTFGGTCSGTSALDELWELGPFGGAGVLQWRQVGIPSAKKLFTALSVTAANESGASFGAFYDSTSKKYFAYLPAESKLASMDMVRVPRVVLAFAAPGAVTTTSAAAVTISLTTYGSQGSSSTTGTKISIWNNFSSAWDATPLGQSAGQSAGAAGAFAGTQTFTVDSTHTYLLTGVTYLLVEPLAASLDTFDTKSVTVMHTPAPSAQWTTNP